MQALVDLGFCTFARKLALDYSRSTNKPVQRAERHNTRHMKFAERCVAGCFPGMSEQDRGMMGKLRLCQGASLRNDDLNSIHPSRCEIILDSKDKDIVRGIRGQSTDTKTGVRCWACSSIALDERGVGWLEEFWKIVISSHEGSLEGKDFLIACPNRFGDEWLGAPSTHQIDTNHVRRIMLSYGRDEFSREEVLEFRLHGAKPALTSVAQFLRLPDRGVNVQGGWRVGKDSMLDTYLREEALFALETQEICLKHLLKNGDERPKIVPITAEALDASLGASDAEMLLRQMESSPIEVVARAASFVVKTRKGSGNFLEKKRCDLYSRAFGQWHRDRWDDGFAAAIFDSLEQVCLFRYEEIVSTAVGLKDSGEAVTVLNIKNVLAQDSVSVYTGGEPLADDVSITERSCESSISVVVNVKTGKVHRHKGKSLDASATACNKVMAKGNVQMFGGQKLLDFDPEWGPCHTCFPTGPEQGLENGCDRLCGALRAQGKQCHGYCSISSAEHDIIGKSAHFCAFHYVPRDSGKSSSSQA